MHPSSARVGATSLRHSSKSWSSAPLLALSLAMTVSWSTVFLLFPDDSARSMASPPEPVNRRYRLVIGRTSGSICGSNGSRRQHDREELRPAARDGAQAGRRLPSGARHATGEGGGVFA